MKQDVCGKRRYCRECDFFTIKANTLSMHVKRTHRKAHIECAQCDDLFTTKGNLFHHVLSKHTDKTIECAFGTCNHTFKTETNHRIHFMRKHTNIGEVMVPIENSNEYRCTECGKRGLQNTIVYHVIQCSSLSPFSGKAAPAVDVPLNLLEELEDSADFFPRVDPYEGLELLEELEDSADFFPRVDPYEGLELLEELEDSADFFPRVDPYEGLELLEDLEDRSDFFPPLNSNEEGAFCLKANVTEKYLPINVFDEFGEFEDFFSECVN